MNDGNGDKEFYWTTRTFGLLVRIHCWHELHNFSKDTIVLALSSTEYIPGKDNYITDKEEFLERNQG